MTAQKSKAKVNLANNPAGKVAAKVVAPLKEFLALETASGIVLLIAAFVAMIWANSPWAHVYEELAHLPIGFEWGSFRVEASLHLVINDALMVLFFYVVGLEIKRELLFGNLANPRKAAFTVFAAIGGMIAPALIFTLFNHGLPTHHGWGIPMATDIAFAVGVLALLGKRIPFALKIFLLAFAIVDDLGAILVIALFYTEHLAPHYLVTAGGFLFFLYLLSYAGIRHWSIGIPVGIAVWICFLYSGIHATIAGVILAFLTPSSLDPAVGARAAIRTQDSTMIDRWVHRLHPWVSYGIMPLFALFNAGVSLKGATFSEVFSQPVSLGILLGLLAGKPIGIFTACFLAVKSKLAQLPEGVRWNHILGVGMLGGVGFTMALFISNLAFTSGEHDIFARTAILSGSALSGICGGLVLLLMTKEKKTRGRRS